MAVLTWNEYWTEYCNEYTNTTEYYTRSFTTGGNSNFYVVFQNKTTKIAF